jgi:6-phosphogluconolactonase
VKHFILFSRLLSKEGEKIMAKQFAYVGSYTRDATGGWKYAPGAKRSEGIIVYEVDPQTGDLAHVQTVPSQNPSFFALDPAQDYLYAINEIDDYEGSEAGSIEAYAIDKATGKLTLLNRQAIGTIPAHLAVDPTGSYVVVANYLGGTFQLLPIAEDGSLGEASSTIKQHGSGPVLPRQAEPRPHSVVFDPSGKYIVTTDLGTDQVQVFQIQNGELVEVAETKVAPGSGPRHVAFHPNGKLFYVINEIGATITLFPFDASSGQVGEALQMISTVSDDFPQKRSTAEIVIHPSGNFLYGSNRKIAEHPLADAIVAFRVDGESGKLTLLGHTTEGIHMPRAFGLDPTSKRLYALNQTGDSIVRFDVDQETGALTPTGVVAETPVPVTIVFKTK